MPLRKLQFLAIAAGIAAALAPASASAATTTTAACATQAVTSPFAAWGDKAAYWLAPDGGFEAGGAGWTLSGAKVVNGNETLGILKGTKSLQLGGAGVTTLSTAISPRFCVDPSNPSFRFVINSPAPATVIQTSINFTAPGGQTLSVVAKVNVINVVGGWSVATVQPLATAIPAVFLGSGTTANIEFTAGLTTAANGIRIDDVFVDPWRR